MNIFSFQFQMNKKERVICEFEVAFKKSFCLRSNLSNDNLPAYASSENGNGLWRPGLKTVVEKDNFLV